MHKSHHIVFTTISQPLILQDLYRNISKFGHLEKTKVWVIGDHKTHPAASGLAAEISSKGLETVYLDIPAQDAWGKNLEFYKRIPYNNDARRLVGYLKALEDGCEVLITLDDDNFPTEDDFVGCHAKTGQNWTGQVISEPGGFHNVCEYLEFKPSRQIFARGFPFEMRGHVNQPRLLTAPKGARIGVIEGLWLNEPDIDATTWLNGKVIGTAYKGPEVLVLGQNTWSPINSQNVSITRELIPAYFFVPMNWPVPGGEIDRYEDIWAGCFLQAIIQGSPFHVAFGRPIVDHRRNPHNYLDDLRCEFWGIILTDWLTKKLRQDFRSQRGEVSDRMLDLADFILESVQDLPKWRPEEMQKFIVHTAENMKLWVKACRRIGV